MSQCLQRLRATSRPCKAAQRRIACRAEPPKFSKIQGDKRVVRGKVYVCLDVRPPFTFLAPCLQATASWTEVKVSSALIGALSVFYDVSREGKLCAEH